MILWTVGQKYSLMFVFGKDKQHMFHSDLSGAKVIPANALLQRNVRKCILNPQWEFAQSHSFLFQLKIGGGALEVTVVNVHPRKSILSLQMRFSLRLKIGFDEHN